MAEVLSSEAEQTAGKAVQTGKDVAKAAKQAATGNYAGAAMTAANSEGIRKTMFVTFFVSLCITAIILIMVLYIIPMAVYEVVVQTFAEATDGFWRGFYSSTDPGWQGVVKGIIAGTGNWASSVLQGIKNVLLSLVGNDKVIYEALEKKENRRREITVVSDATSPSASLVDKMKLVQERYTARVDQIIDTLEKSARRKTGWFSWFGAGQPWLDAQAEKQFKTEFKEGWDVYGPGPDTPFPEINAMKQENTLWAAYVVRDLSDRQKMMFAALYDVMSDNDFGQTRISDYMRWLGHASSPGDTLTMNVLDTTLEFKGWTGTYLPQYLMDEAKLKSEEAYKTALDTEGDTVIENAGKLYDMQRARIQEVIDDAESQLAIELSKPAELQDQAVIQALQDKIDEYKQRLSGSHAEQSQEEEAHREDLRRKAYIEVLETYQRSFGVSAVDLNIYAYVGTLSAVPERGPDIERKNLMKVNKSGNLVEPNWGSNLMYQPGSDPDSNLKTIYNNKGGNKEYTYFYWKTDFDGSLLYKDFVQQYFPNYAKEKESTDYDSSEGYLVVNEWPTMRKKTITTTKHFTVWSNGTTSLVNGSSGNPYAGNKSFENALRQAVSQYNSLHRTHYGVSCYNPIVFYNSIGYPVTMTVSFVAEVQEVIEVPAIVVGMQAFKYYYVVYYNCPYYISMRPESEMLQMSGILEGDHQEEYLESLKKVGRPVSGG